MSGSGVVVLFSGGLDSAVLLWEAKAQGGPIVALHVQYGQANGYQESAAVGALATEAGVDLLTVSLPLFGARSAMHIGVGAPGARVLPGRNLALIGLGVNLAAARGMGAVWIGSTASDVADYPDCGTPFVWSAGEAARLAYGVTVEAPLLGSMKRDVWRRARELGFPVELTWSCYQADRGKPCGRCNACRCRDRGGS